MTAKYSHDLQYITIQNRIHLQCQDTFQLPKGTWQKKLNAINEKIQQFGIDEDINCVLANDENNETIDPSNVLQFEQVMSTLPPPATLQIVQVFLQGEYCKYNHHTAKFVRIDEYIHPKCRVINLSEHRYQTVAAHKLQLIDNDQDLQNAQTQYSQMIEEIELLDHALQQYSNEEQIEYCSPFFIEYCEENGLYDARITLGDEHPFCDIQPDEEAGKIMMADLFQHLYKKTGNATSPHPSIATKNISKCNIHGDPTSDCDSIIRLLSILDMHSHLDMVKNEGHQNHFMEYMTEQYVQFLDDYIHLMCNHSHHLEIINVSLEPCDIMHCSYTTRRHRKKQHNNDNLIEDDSLKFYLSIIDSLHFYLHHLFDVALRIRSIPIKEKQEQSPQSEFARICTVVKTGRELTKSFDQLQNHSKFNFSISQTGILNCYSLR